jgi:DNA-directed RNA polymerase specialized sigma24 family protein
MAFLSARERDFMILRFVEQWEYHEIPAIRGNPIGTLQSMIFNSKKKLVVLVKFCKFEWDRLDL